MGTACPEKKFDGSPNTHKWANFTGETTPKDFEDDLVISSFVSDPGATTQPTVIFSKVKLGLGPKINALATIVISIVGLGVVVARFILHCGEQRRILKLSKIKPES